MEFEDQTARIPFYMTYPLENMYQMEMEYEKDLDRMKELYPREVRELMPYVESFCDQLEFEGSRIYDEEPDRQMLEREAMALFEQIQESRRAAGIVDAVEEQAAVSEAGSQEQAAVPEMKSEGQVVLEEKSGADDRKPTACVDARVGQFAFPIPEELLAERDREVVPAAAREESVPLKAQEQNGGARGGRPPMGPGRPPMGPGRPPMGPGRPPMGPGQPPAAPGRPCNNWMCDLVGILFREELYRRRCRNRRCQRWW